MCLLGEVLPCRCQDQVGLVKDLLGLVQLRPRPLVLLLESHEARREREELLHLVPEVVLQSLYLGSLLLRKNAPGLVLRRNLLVRLGREVDAVALSGGDQLALEPLDFARKISKEHFLVDEGIKLGLVPDVLGAKCVFQCRQGFFDVALGRGYRRDDARLGPPAQRVLEQAGKLRLSIGNVGAAVDQGVDDTPEGQQALVDEARFGGPLVFSPGALDVFAASQIDQVQLSRHQIILAVLRLALSVNGYGENRVTATAQVVAFCGRHLTLYAALLEPLEAVGCVDDVPFLHSLYHGGEMVFPRVVVVDLELGSVVRAQQIAQFLVVELDIGAADAVLNLLVVELFEEGIEDSGDDAGFVGEHAKGTAHVARHSVCLSCAGLAVGEDGAVEAGENLVTSVKSRDGQMPCLPRPAWA